MTNLWTKLVVPSMGSITHVGSSLSSSFVSAVVDSSPINLQVKKCHNLMQVITAIWSIKHSHWYGKLKQLNNYTKYSTQWTHLFAQGSKKKEKKNSTKNSNTHTHTHTQWHQWQFKMYASTYNKMMTLLIQHATCVEDICLSVDGWPASQYLGLFP